MAENYLRVLNCCNLFEEQKAHDAGDGLGKMWGHFYKWTREYKGSPTRSVSICTELGAFPRTTAVADLCSWLTIWCGFKVSLWRARLIASLAREGTEFRVEKREREAVNMRFHEVTNANKPMTSAPFHGGQLWIQKMNMDLKIWNVR